MNIVDTLTVMFVVLKLTGVITWSWWLVFSPLIIGVVMYILLFTISALFEKYG